MIEGGIHAGEIEGKDAGLMLLRDIAIDKKYPGLLDHVTVLFVPIFNVDGHERFGPYNRINQKGPEEMGWRTTANSLNLNRDFLKADTEETRAWLELFNEWKPDFFIDCHTTDGADYQYVVTYIVDILGNMVPSLTDWTQGRLPRERLEDHGAGRVPHVSVRVSRRVAQPAKRDGHVGHAAAVRARVRVAPEPARPSSSRPISSRTTPSA